MSMAHKKAICQEIRDYGAVFKSDKYQELSQKMIENGGNRFSIQDTDEFFELLISEVHEIETACKKHPNDQFIADYQKTIAGIPKSIQAIQCLPNLSTKDPSLLSSTVRGSDERAFIQLCHETNMKMLKSEKVYFGDYIDIFFVELWCIYKLFMFGTILDEENSNKRETGCKQILMRFDSLFAFEDIKGKGDSYLYHIKNAVCHGHVVVNRSDVTFTNQTAKRTVYVGRISLGDLTEGFMRMKNELLNIIICDKTEFNNAFDVIECILNHQPLEKDLTASHISSFHMMASYESNFKQLYDIIRTKGADRRLMEGLYTTDTGINISRLRNGLSHRAEIKEGKLCVYEKDGT